MTIPKYIDKLTSGPIPLQPKQARIALRYSAGKAAKGSTQEAAETLQETFDDLVALAGHGFLGAQGLEVAVEAPAPDVLEVRLSADPLPLDLIVIALRLVISANDNSPEDFQRLLGALDGDMETALQVYGGTNFEEEVNGIELSVEGKGPAQTFDPFHLAGQAGPIWQAGRLTVQGWARHMPDEETEDHILRLAGMRAFLPVGVEPDYEPGDEEYFPSGDNLLIDTVSIEDASLRAILAMLAPGEVPTLVEQG
ncbi:hypothetical protein [Shinella zoogloeoides]